MSAEKKAAASAGAAGGTCTAMLAGVRFMATTLRALTVGMNRNSPVIRPVAVDIVV
jgi:hypothetical protein